MILHNATVCVHVCTETMEIRLRAMSRISASYHSLFAPLRGHCVCPLASACAAAQSASAMLRLPPAQTLSSPRVCVSALACHCRPSCAPRVHRRCRRPSLHPPQCSRMVRCPIRRAPPRYARARGGVQVAAAAGMSAASAVRAGATSTSDMSAPGSAPGKRHTPEATNGDGK